ncbi:MAG: deoxyribodipyrimidine photo-lyase, partial [Alteromonas oceani]
WDSEFSKHWTPGEEGAADKLSDFIKHAAKGYEAQRNIPSVRGTSRLSPHLHFGEISPNQVWYALLNAFDDQGSSDL